MPAQQAFYQDLSTFKKKKKKGGGVTSSLENAGFNKVK
jgi:hypothetical protein